MHLDSSKQQINQIIKAKAHSLGFSLAGIITPEPPSGHFRFLDWLNVGFHAGMEYLATPYHRDTRADPKLLEPQVRSILVLGLSYPLHPSYELESKHIGLVSGYASGEDYHERIPRMISPLLDLLKEEFGPALSCRVYTDSAPILERELGVRAGLGWIGKNSLLISPLIGSNFLLAEVLLNQDLEPDLAFMSDFCGTCTRCVDACPTSCILMNRTIDSSRCLSYHTIENHAEIPPEIMEKMGNWVFGCDICQMVCPWNKAERQEHLELRLKLSQMIDALGRDEKKFKEIFGHTVLNRAKWVGLTRNILVRLGTVPAAAPALQGFLENQTNPLLQITARWALGKNLCQENKEPLQLN